MAKGVIALVACLAAVAVGEEAAQPAGAMDELKDLAAPTDSNDLATAEPVPTIAIPETYQVVLETDIMMGGVAQEVLINVTSSFAPLGAEQFYKTLKDHFYDGACLFRVVPDFVIQFGIAADPEMTKKWSVPILDDPVEVSNEAGTVAYATAGPDTRTTQLFVNYVDNKALDNQGFAPIGQVVKGMDALKNAYNPTPGKPGGVDQMLYERDGNAWLKPKVPKINMITKAYIRGDP